MAGYLVPPTKNPGDVLTSALWNTYIRDNLDFGMVRPIADVLLGASAASFDFTGIPATFAHLKIVAQLRGDTAAASTGCLLRFNNDTAANYDYQLLQGSAATATALEVFAATAASVGSVAAATAGAGLFGEVEIEVPNYGATTANKTLTSEWALKTGTSTGNMQRGIVAGFWRSSAAGNRITILPNAGLFVAGSRVTIYGMGGI